MSSEILNIHLDSLKLENDADRLTIFKLFEYNRFPLDKDFLTIKPLLDDITIRQAKIDLLEELLEDLDL